MNSIENDPSIVCPKCGEKIHLTKALMSPIEADLKLKFQEELKAHENKVRADTEKAVSEKYDTDLKDLRTQVSEKDERIKEVNARDLVLNQKEREISDREKCIQSLVDEQVKLKVADAEERIMKTAEEKIAEKYELNLKDLENQVSEKDKKIKELGARELYIKKKERELMDKESQIDFRVEEQVSNQIEEISKKAKEQVSQKSSLQIKDLESQVIELQNKNKEFQEQELELRQKQRQLESDKESFEIEKQREIDAAKAEVYKKAKSDSENEFKLKLRDKDLRLEQLTKTVDELNKKLEQGSQQLQGESQELELEDFLCSKFIYDKVEPVPKGFRGADIIQTVKTQFGQECGKIIWESKRTKNWSNDWISKLKEDQREAKADIAIIVSEVLPDGVTHIGQQEGVWVVSFEAVGGICIALREYLLQIEKIKKSQVGKSEKMEVLYDYLCSNEFRQKIEGIVEAFTTMKTDLESEKRAFNKQWQKRETQIEKVLKNTTGMYGGLQALIGSELPEIKALEMPAVDEMLLDKE